MSGPSCIRNYAQQLARMGRNARAELAVETPDEAQPPTARARPGVGARAEPA